MGWHMKQDLAPILFYANDKPAVRAKRTDPVAAAARSNHALTKAFSKRTNDDYPVHSFTSLLADLATVAPTTTARHDMPARSPRPPHRCDGEIWCWTSSYSSMSDRAGPRLVNYRHIV